MRPFPVLKSFAVFVISLCFASIANAQSPLPHSSAFAEPLPVDRGAAAVWQSLQKLQTRALFACRRKR